MARAPMARAPMARAPMVGWGVGTPIFALFIVIIQMDWYLILRCFSLQLNVPTINTMRVNEEEVHGVSDELPPAVKRQLKRKRPIVEVLTDVPACSSSYQPLVVPERPSRPQIPANINTPESFFSLFIMPTHFQLIARHTNINAEHEKAAENVRSMTISGGAR